MKSIAVAGLKARCLSLVEDVARTGEPLIVTKRGKPLARVVAADAAGAHPQSTLTGTVTIIGDILEPVLPPSCPNRPKLPVRVGLAGDLGVGVLGDSGGP